MTADQPGDPDDGRMAEALELARRQLGRVAPNPAVGCLIVRDGAVLARGVTGEGGRPHAEEAALAALAALGLSAAGCDAVVTLEPCAGRSSGAPGCADLLIAAGVVRVVIACRDPHGPAAGGAERLRAAGVAVRLGVREQEAQALNAGFFTRIATGRPLVRVAGDETGCDAGFDLKPGESFEAALDRMGAAGLTRVWAKAGSPLATALRSRGLVGEDAGG